jgi:hypothetical protein
MPKSSPIAYLILSAKLSAYFEIIPSNASSNLEDNSSLIPLKISSFGVSGSTSGISF